MVVNKQKQTRKKRMAVNRPSSFTITGEQGDWETFARNGNSLLEMDVYCGILFTCIIRLVFASDYFLLPRADC